MKTEKEIREKLKECQKMFDLSENDASPILRIMSAKEISILNWILDEEKGLLEL